MSSFQNEIAGLNEKISSLSEDLTLRTKLAEDGSDPIGMAKDLLNEVESLKKKLAQSEKKLSEKDKELAESQNTASRLEVSVAETEEKLSLMEQVTKNDQYDAAKSTLEGLQTIWKRVGVPMKDRDDTRRAIMSSLEDTCKAKLQEGREFKRNVEHETTRLLQEITDMGSSLGKEIDTGDCDFCITLLERLDAVRAIANDLRPEYDAANERKVTIVNGVNAILDSTGADRDSIAQCLKNLLGESTINTDDTDADDEDEDTSEDTPEDTSEDIEDVADARPQSSRAKRAAKMKEVSAVLDALNSAVSVPAKTLPSGKTAKDERKNNGTHASLSKSFLDKCERELGRMRIKKSETLAANATRVEKAKMLIDDMNMSAEELEVLIETTKPSWWEGDEGNSVSATVCGSETTVNATERFARHLSFVTDLIDRVSGERRQLSEALKGVVNKTQQTLLATVDEEADANEAYASFHNALFKLPSLSQEHIRACTDEMQALVAGVDAMIQSEIEALTVVWEALSCTSRQRGEFWGTLKKATGDLEKSNDSPFGFHVSDDGQSIEPAEEWVAEAMNDCHQIYDILKIRLLKLETVHQEVEALRAKQNAKSLVISLDSEIRILGAKLDEFEDETCNKQRLLTKKSGSSGLLKEERFRKQMQGKFTKKLGELTDALNTWQKFQGDDLDCDIVSKDVQMLLDNPNRMDKMVEKRTEFMHLRTVRTKKLKRQATTSSSTSTSEEESPPKRQKSNERTSRPVRTNSQSSVASTSSSSEESKPRASSTKRTRRQAEQDTKTAKAAKTTSTARTTRATRASKATKKQVPTSPFLAALSPSNETNENKENPPQPASKTRTTGKSVKAVKAGASRPKRKAATEQVMFRSPLQQQKDNSNGNEIDGESDTDGGSGNPKKPKKQTKAKAKAKKEKPPLSSSKKPRTRARVKRQAAMLPFENVL